jgi:hypothetical protein
VRWKGFLIENITNTRKCTTTTQNGISQNSVFLIFFKLGKLVEDYHLLLSSKPLEGDFIFLEKWSLLYQKRQLAKWPTQRTAAVTTRIPSYTKYDISTLLVRLTSTSSYENTTLISTTFFGMFTILHERGRSSIKKNLFGFRCCPKHLILKS